MLNFRLGTIGYAYKDWQGPFYPRGLGQSRWLENYAGQFNCVELNTTFHAIPPPERIRDWCEKVGPNFRFAVKTRRSITHERPLRDSIQRMQEFVELMREFGQNLGPILLQLPPKVTFDAFDDLDRMLGSLPNDLRYAIEFRHPSWVQDSTTQMLRGHKACWVGVHHLDHPILRRLRATADFLYIRLIGRHDQFTKKTHEQIDVSSSLIKWHAAIQREIAANADITELWLFSANDYAGHAPATIRRFANIAGGKLHSPPSQFQPSLF
jgi:uncharacterized protein YecE (DUF72 family)